MGTKSQSTMYRMDTHSMRKVIIYLEADFKTTKEPLTSVKGLSDFSSIRCPDSEHGMVEKDENNIDAYLACCIVAT